MLSPVHTAPGNTQFQYYAGKLNVYLSLCLQLRKEDKNNHELLVNCCPLQLFFSLYMHAPEIGNNSRNWFVTGHRLLFSFWLVHTLTAFPDFFNHLHSYGLTTSAFIRQFLSSLDYYPSNLIEQSSKEGIQLILTYHTSVIQQRKIVWGQTVSLFLKNVWWVLLQLPFAENHEYKSQEDKLFN